MLKMMRAIAFAILITAGASILCAAQSGGKTNAPGFKRATNPAKVKEGPRFAVSFYQFNSQYVVENNQAKNRIVRESFEPLLDVLPNLGTIALFFGKRLRVTDERRQHVMEFDEGRAITDRKLLKRCGVVIGAVLVGFGLHSQFHLEPATIALGGAAALLLLRREDPEETLKAVEWPTCFFFLGPFIMVSALVVVGVVLLRTVPARPAGRRAPRWMPWAATGLVLSVASFAVVGFAEDEFSALEWTSVLGLLVLGLWALGTSAVIAVDARRVQSI